MHCWMRQTLEAIVLQLWTRALDLLKFLQTPCQGCAAQMDLCSDGVRDNGTLILHMLDLRDGGFEALGVKANCGFC